MTVPKMLRRTSWTCPDPPHVWQRCGDVPGAEPLPPQRSHPCIRLTSTSRCTPNAASRNSSVTSANRSSPWAVRVRRPPPRRRPNVPVPKNASNRSEMSPNGGRHRAAAAVRVVLRALVAVGQDLVRGRDLLEPLDGGRIGVHVRVVLASEPPIGLPDVLGRRVACDAEDLVEVAYRRHRDLRRRARWRARTAGGRRLAPRPSRSRSPWPSAPRPRPSRAPSCRPGTAPTRSTPPTRRCAGARCRS